MWSLIAAIAVVVTFMLLVAFAIYRNPKVPHDVLNHICFESTEDLAKALRSAADAHHVYEQEHGKDENWPEWYAEYMNY